MNTLVDLWQRFDAMLDLVPTSPERALQLFQFVKGEVSAGRNRDEALADGLRSAALGTSPRSSRPPGDITREDDYITIDGVRVPRHFIMMG